MKRELSAEKHQQRLDCYNSGMSDKESAAICGISATTYRDWRCKHRLVVNLSRRDYKFNNKGRIVKDDSYKPTEKEMPPSFRSECITIVSNNKMVVEDYLKRFGNKIEPIKMKLSEVPRPYNMRGVVIGSSFYRSRAVVN